mmetsp:Transcript_12839/g.26226  ORF Transcript_12839/g.26226 Transcript_12839/m.26226 type:complete len:2023 (-) Transcript_12839:565-6633(-)
MQALKAVRSPLPLRSALTQRGGDLSVACAGSLIFQCGNVLVHYDYKAQTQTALSFSGRLNQWTTNAAGCMLACSVSSKSMTRTAVYSFPSLDLICELPVKQGIIVGGLEFSRCGYRLLVSEVIPNNLVEVWSLRRPPAAMEPESKPDPTLLRVIQIQDEAPLKRMFFNPNDHSEFVIFTSREIMKYEIRNDNGTEKFNSVVLFNLRNPGRDLLDRIQCATWGPDGAIYCGLDNGEIRALSESSSSSAQEIGNDVAHVSYDKTVTDYTSIINVLKFDMAEPATGLYSDLDIRESYQLQSPVGPVARQVTTVYKPTSRCRVTAMVLQGSHLVVATSNHQLLVFAFLHTSKKGTSGQISAVKGILEQSCSTETFESLLVDEKGGSLISLSQDGTIRSCPLENLSRAISNMNGSLNDEKPILGFSTVQHFLPSLLCTSPRASFVGLNENSAALPLSNNRLLFASQSGFLRMINHHKILCERQLSSRILKGSTDTAAILATEVDHDKAPPQVPVGMVRQRVSVRKEGDLVAVGCSNGVVTVLKCSSENSLHVVYSTRLHKSDAMFVSFSRDSKFLASVALDSVVVINMDNQRTVARWEIPSESCGIPLCHCWLGNGSFLVGLEFGKIHVCYVESKQMQTLDLGVEACELLAGDGFKSSEFLAISKDKCMRYYNADKKELKCVEKSPFGFHPVCAALSPDSTIVAIGGINGEILLNWRHDESKRILIEAHDPNPFDMKDHKTPEYFGTTDLEFARHGPALLSNGASLGCFIWDISSFVGNDGAWWSDQDFSTEKVDAQVSAVDLKVSEKDADEDAEEDLLYCPLTMGSAVCKDKIEDGCCSECGIFQMGLSIGDFAVDLDDDVEPITYCPMTLGAPVCTDCVEDGQCSKCGMEVVVEIPAQKEEEREAAEEKPKTSPEVEEAKGSDPVDKNVSNEESKAGVSGGSDISKKLGQLRSKLKAMVDRNKELDGFEKLDRGEFIIDEEMKAFLERKGQENADLTRGKITRECKEKELVAFRITEQTREQFSTPRLVIEPFKSGIVPVSNYPILTLQERDIQRAQKIEYLRRMSMLEQRFVVENLDRELGATNLGSPKLSPMPSPGLSSPKSFSGFSSGDEYFPELGWPANKAEWETVGVLPEDPYTRVASYAMDVNKKRLEKEAVEIADMLKNIGKPKDDFKDDPKDAKAQQGKKEKKEKISWRKMSLGELPEFDEKFLIQHPSTCLTRLRKIVQVHAVQVSSRILANRFNDVFDKYYREKQSCHEMILEKTRRIMDVREELRALIAKCKSDYADVEARRLQLEKWKDELEEKKYNEDVLRARIMGKKIPLRRKKGESQAERQELKKREDEMTRRKKEEELEEKELTRVIFSTTLSDDEIPDHLFSVRDEEIKAPRPLNSEEKRRAAELAARKSAGGDSAPQRALQDFMGGVLKKKGNVADDSEVIEKEPWMVELPPREMTPEQKKLLKEVEKKEQEFRDTRLAQRRDVLEQLKKLNAEIHDLLEKFDKKLSELGECRFAVDQILERRDYLCASFLDSTSSKEIDELTSKVMNARRATLKQQRSARDKNLLESKEKVEKFRQTVAYYASKDAKEMKVFRKMFEGRSDEFDHLLKLYTRRVKKSKHAAMSLRPMTLADRDYNAQEALVCQAESVEDWLERLSKLAKSRNPGEISVEIDGIRVSAELLGEKNPKPEELEIESGMLDRLIEMRIRKIFAEQKHAVAVRILASHEAVLKKKQDANREAEGEMEAIEKFLNHRQRSAVREGVDNHITVEISQGLVEAVDTSPMSGLSAWTMFDRQLIEAYNKAILKEGQLNLSTLKEIVVQYRKLRSKMWAGRKQTLLLAMAQASTWEVKLMRVTKDLQELIKSGGSGQKYKEQKQLCTRKMQWNEKIFKKKVAEKEKAIAKYEKEYRKFMTRNKKLGGSLSDLHGTVSKLQKIRGDKGGKGVIEAGTKRKMKTLAQIKKLSNIAEIQREDIFVLRNERERLQRKSFPMFDKAFSDRRLVSPDVFRERRTKKHRDSRSGGLKLPAIN